MLSSNNFLSNERINFFFSFEQCLLLRANFFLYSTPKKMREATPLSPVKYLWGRMDAYSLVPRQRSESGEHTFLCTESRASCREKKKTTPNPIQLHRILHNGSGTDYWPPANLAGLPHFVALHENWQWWQNASHSYGRTYQSKTRLGIHVRAQIIYAVSI